MKRECLKQMKSPHPTASIHYSGLDGLWKPAAFWGVVGSVGQAFSPVPPVVLAMVILQCSRVHASSHRITMIGEPKAFGLLGASQLSTSRPLSAADLPPSHGPSLRSHALSEERRSSRAVPGPASYRCKPRNPAVLLRI